VTSLDLLSRWTGVTEAINVFIKCAKRGPLAMPEAFLRLMFVPHYYPRAALVHFLVTWQPSSALLSISDIEITSFISHSFNEVILRYILIPILLLTISYFVQHRKLTLFNCYSNDTMKSYIAIFRFCYLYADSKDK